MQRILSYHILGLFLHHHDPHGSVFDAIDTFAHSPRQDFDFRKVHKNMVIEWGQAQSFYSIKGPPTVRYVFITVKCIH